MKLSRLGLAVGVSFLLLGAYPAASQQPAVNYHLIKTISIPPAAGNREGFDYLYFDNEARRVYVTHGVEVVVLNADTYETIGKITGLGVTHGVLTLKEFGKGYITDGEGQKVVIFDLNTLKITGEVKTNQVDTDGIVYDPATKNIFSINGNSKTITVIDPKTETALKTFSVAAPRRPASSTARGRCSTTTKRKATSWFLIRKLSTSRRDGPQRRQGRPLRS